MTSTHKSATPRLHDSDIFATTCNDLQPGIVFFPTEGLELPRFAPKLDGCWTLCDCCVGLVGGPYWGHAHQNHQTKTETQQKWLPYVAMIWCWQFLYFSDWVVPGCTGYCGIPGDSRLFFPPNRGSHGAGFCRPQKPRRDRRATTLGGGPLLRSKRPASNVSGFNETIRLLVIAGFYGFFMSLFI